MTPEQQRDLLTAGTEEILPAGELYERLLASAKERRPLRVKQGFDPTAPDIHLGHSVGLRKLRQFQDLGHQVVLIVGNYTGMVGDPSGRNKTRPQLTEDQVEDNARTYLEQFFKVLERDPAPPRLPVEVHRNGDWFSKMTFMEVMRLASQYTIARMLERDDFSKRYAAQQPIAIHELFYPLMQGYDSVAIRADVELGATEQKFNLIVGRTLQELHEQRPQVVMTLPVLPGLDGVQRMSKSLGNYIGVTDEPSNMFGKVMSLPDAAMALYWRLVTDANTEELARVNASLGDPSVNPMQIKKQLGQRLVRMYHGVEAAERAQSDFELQFSKRATPEHLEEFGRAALDAVAKDITQPTVLDYAVASGISESRGAARRMVEQRAVRVDDELVAAWDQVFDPAHAHIVRIGRKMRRYRPD